MTKVECQAKMNLLGIDYIEGVTLRDINKDRFIFKIYGRGESEGIGYLRSALGRTYTTFFTYEEMLNAALNLVREKKQND